MDSEDGWVHQRGGQGVTNPHWISIPAPMAMLLMIGEDWRSMSTGRRAGAHPPQAGPEGKPARPSERR
jgi:hypothetical protein